MELIVEFAGSTRTTSTTLTFGRDADLEIDTNPYLHRVAGAFVPQDGTWWVQNLGTKLHLTIVGSDGTRTDLPPEARHAIVPGSGVVRIVAGRATYELEYCLPSDDVPAPTVTPPSVGAMTTPFDFSLTPREVDFLVTFARPVILGLSSPLPTYVEVAQIWKVSPKTLDNSLQSIKRKFRGAGLVRDPSLDALVRMAVQHSLVTRADLERANLDSDEPTPAGA